MPDNFEPAGNRNSLADATVAGFDDRVDAEEDETQANDSEEPGAERLLIERFQRRTQPAGLRRIALQRGLDQEPGDQSQRHAAR